jgi:hypothetical protein
LSESIERTQQTLGTTPELMATERHNYMTGCPEDDCHGSIKRHPTKIDTLEPDIHAQLSHKDFINNVDPAMAAVRTRLAEGVVN